MDTDSGTSSFNLIGIQMLALLVVFMLVIIYLTDQKYFMKIVNVSYEIAKFVIVGPYLIVMDHVYLSRDFIKNKSRYLTDR